VKQTAQIAISTVKKEWVYTNKKDHEETTVVCFCHNSNRWFGIIGRWIDRT
jgi:hypothetical protein